MRVHLEEIAQVALTVSDLARAKAFYGETLGMKFLFDAGTMAFFQCGAVRVMLGLAEQPVTPAGTILYYKVGDLQGVHAALTEKAVPFLQPPHLVAKMPDHDLWMAFLKDPDGNVLGLMSEVARGSSCGVPRVDHISQRKKPQIRRLRLAQNHAKLCSG